MFLKNRFKKAFTWKHVQNFLKHFKQQFILVVELIDFQLLQDEKLYAIIEYL